MFAQSSYSVRVTLLIFLISGVLTVSACATATNPGASAGDPSRTKRAQEISELVRKGHEASEFGAEAPYLVDEYKTKEFMARFGSETCGISGNPADVKKEEFERCNLLFKKAVVQGLASRYFAADRLSVEKRCHSESLACQDPKVLESWIRDSHNAAIQLSLQEKLGRIQDWKKGGLTDSELILALHIDPKTLGFDSGGRSLASKPMPRPENSLGQVAHAPSDQLREIVR